MYKYTIKKDIEKGIYLLNEQGEEVAATDILEKCGDRRVFAFNGKMGAGKTTFIKQLCEAMGTEDIVNSPTFAIVNVYEVKNFELRIKNSELTNSSALSGTSSNLEEELKEVYHFDCYRIKDLREAMDMGTEEYLYSGNYCFIEWAEMIEPLLPDDLVTVEIEVLENGDRVMTIN